MPPARDEIVIGITDYAQDQFGDIVFVELRAIRRAPTNKRHKE